MGQNKHVGLEINKGHGQLDKTFNKDYNQSFRTVCLAGISSFYITTRNYTTAVASHVTKASDVTQSSGGSRPFRLLHITSCCPAHAVFLTKVFDDHVVIFSSICVLLGSLAAFPFLGGEARQSTKISRQKEH